MARDAEDRAASRRRVLADMATLGMAGEMRKVRYRRAGVEVAPETAHANKQAARKQRKGEAKAAKLTPTEKALAEHTRDRPTKERLAKGAFERADMGRVDMANYDPGRAGEKALLDWKAKAGGVGEMYLRGQVTRRMAEAAAVLMEAFELAQTSGLSCGEVRERVDGGKLDLSGNRLRAAGEAWASYQGALARLSPWGRYLVEKRVVEGRPMDEIVCSPSLADAVGAGGLGLKRKNGIAILKDALNHLADVFHLPAA